MVIFVLCLALGPLLAFTLRPAAPIVALILTMMPLENFLKALSGIRS